MMFGFRKIMVAFFAVIILSAITCKKSAQPNPTPQPSEKPGIVEQWITQANEQALLQKQSKLLPLDTNATIGGSLIELNESLTFQQIDGFGFTLTGGSARLINTMLPEKAELLLQDLFGKSSSSAGISYLRLSLGASDLSDRVFSYNDLPAGQTDEKLEKFSLADDLEHLVPVLKKIVTINPAIKFLASPWSPPIWMKTNASSIGGELLPAYYDAYARYIVKYIQAMKMHGINIDAITIQNEPHHPGNNPSMYMPSHQQAAFIKNALGPLFSINAIQTKIIIWDHNCNNPDYPISVLNDAAARPYIDGSAFHLYEGDISALSQVHTAYPDKKLYFTEQWTGAKGSFAGDFVWHIKNVIIGSMRNWSRIALEWNLANDPLYGPHTPGGCTECKGALTINGSTVQKNVSYYIIAQISKFVPAGSVRIESSMPPELPNAAFKTPDGKKVVLVLNETDLPKTFTIKCGDISTVATLLPKSAATYKW